MVAVASKRNHTGPDVLQTPKARFVRRGPIGSGRVPLQTLRASAGLTQEQLGEKIGMAQGDVSKLENAATMDDRTVATVRKYLSALGSELELAATSKLGHRFVLVGHGEAGDEPAARTESSERRAQLAWEQVHHLLAGLMAYPSKSLAERHARSLIWGGLSYFRPLNGGETFTEVQRANAYKALGLGTKAKKADHARRYLDVVLSHPGRAAPTRFDETAALACEAFGRPATDAAELAKMLAKVSEKGGRGPPTKDRPFTRNMIAAWLLGDDKWGTRTVGTAERKRRLKQ
jgi:transcriptional regulator with XRE-family HTH domain